jgi:hypothetical protein
MKPTHPHSHKCLRSLRDNITFGNEFNQAKYDAVVHACALELDLQILANGDQTKVRGRRRWREGCSSLVCGGVAGCGWNHGLNHVA